MIDSMQNPIFKNLFARLLSFFLTIISLFTIAKPQSVALTVQTTTPETVTIEYKNNTGKVITPEQRWTLELKTENGYQEVPFAEDFSGWIEIAETCPPAGGGTRTIQAERCFGHPLREGEYRFTFYYVCTTAAGDVSGEMQSVSITFTIPAE